MKQFFTYTFYAKKTVRFLLLLLILLVAIPVLEIQQAEAQTTKTGNFFTRRFKRKNKFQKKSKNSTVFQRKPFKCSEVGKPKVEQVKVSKKQLRRWEEERLVKAEQERFKEERQARNEKSSSEGGRNKNEDVVLSASSKNDIEQIAKSGEDETVNKIRNKIENKNEEDLKIEKDSKTKEEETEQAGWYSSEKPDAPKISPILDQKNEITNHKNKEELEIAAKYARLGYTIVLESSNEKQLQTVKKYLLSIGTEENAMKIKSSEINHNNEVVIRIEK